MPTKIILDTDIGTDIDDAYALAFALRHPDIEVKAVTTVTGYPVERARLVQHLLQIAGQSGISVAAGMSLPMYDLDPEGRKAYLERKPNHTQVADNLDASFPLGEAVRLLLDVVDQNARDIGIVSIGPLTNIAAALMADPELPQKVKFISMMGAELDRNWHEYNIRMDPEAANIVFSCGAEMFLATWEVSRQVVLLPEHLEILRGAKDPLCSELLRCTELWWPHRKNKPGPVVYDVSPLLWSIDASWFETLSTSVRIETANPSLRGVTYLEPEKEPVFAVSKKIRDPEEARSLLLETIKAD